jgi:MYXO-CTERM domain-containing protein
VTVGGATTVGLNNSNRWSTFDVNGGTFTSTDTSTGLQIGAANAGNAALLVRAGTATVEKVKFFGTGTGAYSGVAKLTGGALYVGSGGISATSTNAGFTPIIKLAGGTLAAKANFSSSVNMSLTGTSTIQAADALSIGHDMALNGIMSGTGGIAKTGAGTTILGGLNTYTGATSVNEGRLRVNGSIASSSGVSVAPGAIVSGYGRVSAISGGGLVEPGSSPGILTAPKVDPSGGLDFDFQFTQPGLPLFDISNASGNDVLHLTDPTPFQLALNSANTITLDFTGASLVTGQTYYGGFFTDALVDGSLVSGATFEYLGTEGATISFDGLVPVADANFATGLVSGQMFKFEVISAVSAVPEPSTWAWGLMALGTIGLTRPRRRIAQAYVTV